MTNYQHIAEQMYAAYCQQAGGLTFDGKPLPSFSGIGLERQTCWKAAAEAAHKQYAQPQADALDAERLDWLIEQGCSHGVVYEGSDKSFWMVWLDGHDAHKDKHQISRYHTAREAIDAARSPAAMAKLIMHCTTEDEYLAAITQCVDARKAAIAAAKENK